MQIFTLVIKHMTIKATAAFNKKNLKVVHAVMMMMMMMMMMIIIIIIIIINKNIV
jgi:hypothetical protein